MDVDVREVAPEVARPFRARVLRPGRPVKPGARPEDALPGARHFAAYFEGMLVGAASVHPEPPSFEAPRATWRLRGLAVEPAYRNRGVGARVLDACVAYVRARGGEAVWCHARLAAARFYRRHGFTEMGAPYEDPETGPHVAMLRRLS